MQEDIRHSECPAGSFYRIRQGESIYTIASRFGFSVGELMLANPYLEPRRIVPGQVIIIPVEPDERVTF